MEDVCGEARVKRGVRMSPAQFAHGECANLQPDGACLGVGVDSLIDTGQPKTCTHRDRCAVASGKRCGYFERVILPLADLPSPRGDAQRQARRASARQTYLGRHVLAGSLERQCPECGGSRLRRHRFCEVCATKHRREGARERVRQYRQLERAAVTL